MTTPVPMTRHVSKFLAGTIALVLFLLLVLLVPLMDQRATAQLQGAPEGELLQVAATEVVPTDQTQLNLSFAPLVRQASPAVVNVYTSRTVRQAVSPFANDPRFRRFFGAPQQQERVQNSLGSGVIVGQDGVIVTNNHVVDGAEEFRIVLSDRREYPAELILADERTDLAVLKLDDSAGELPTLPFADTKNLEVGDIVLAIGNPFGVGQTVTSGIVSATARTDVGISDYAFFIQTDAAINPGNSGGALIDNEGRLVGVNTAIFSRSGGSNGIGFAIPSEMVQRVVDAAVNEGGITRPWLGLKGQAVSFDIAQAQGLERPVGVIVTEVYEDGPAEQADLRRGDLITAIDGREVYDERGLNFFTATMSPGETVELDVLRDGASFTAEVPLVPPPGASDAELRLLDGRHPFSGAEVAELSPALAESMGSDPFAKGLLVNRMLRRSYAWRIGVRPGDIIVAVNGRQTTSFRELDRALESGDRSWQVTIERNGQRVTSTVRL
ncbi:MAG: DegQ family serine endoprotease [Pseudomonadota bacterium]